MKLIYLSILLSLFIHSVSALLPNTDCVFLKNRVDRACNQDQMRASCENLRLCQGIRTECPQPKDSIAGCTDFASCLEERAEEENTSYFCGYKWTGQPNDGICYLRNQRTDSFSYRCPGYKNRFDQYRDSNFTCEGHRLRAISDREGCNRAIGELQVYCPNRDSGVPNSVLVCEETSYSLTPVDSEISPTTAQNGSRNTGIAQPKEELSQSIPAAGSGSSSQ